MLLKPLSLRISSLVKSDHESHVSPKLFSDHPQKRSWNILRSPIDKSNLNHFENSHKISLPISHIWKRSTQWNNPLYYDTVWQTTVGEIQKLNITLSLTIFIRKIPHLIHAVVILKSRQWIRSFFVKLISYGFETSMNNIIFS